MRRTLNWEIKGYDPGQLAIAGRRLLDLPIDRRYFETSMDETETVDLLFCSEVIEHIRDPITYLNQVKKVLQPNGLLLMTTPNGDAVRRGMPAEEMPILSPGQHLILYNRNTLDWLLKENGFPYIRFSESEHQIRVCASRTSFHGEANYLTRDLFRQYLALSAVEHEAGSSLALGFHYRLLKEFVNVNCFAKGHEIYERMRLGILSRYGYDIEEPDQIVMPAPGAMNLAEFGERWPFNLCGIWYCRGIIQLLHERTPERASTAFAAASCFARAMRATLNRFGADDMETADLCRAAEIARLSAMAEYEPQQAVQLLTEISENRSDWNQEILAQHVEHAKRKLFTDLVNLGH